MPGPPRPHPPFTATVLEETDDAATVAFTGELDLLVCDEVRAALDAALDRGAQSLVVDLSEVRLLDSRTIGVLIAIMKRTVAAGGSFVVRSPQPHIRKTLSILGLSQPFGLTPG